MVAVALTLAASTGHGAVPASAGADLEGSHVVSWGSVEVIATPALAFEVLTDYGRMARFLPGMVTSKVVSREGKSVVVEQTADEGVLFFKQRVTARLAVEELPPYRLTLRSLSGSFKELTGTYVLTRRQDSTLIEYNARFIPDFHLPRAVGKYAVQHSLERHLDGLAAEIRRRAKGDDSPLQPVPPAAGPSSSGRSGPKAAPGE